MKTVLFLVRKDLITLDRFLLVAGKLAESNVRSVFLDMEGGLKMVIADSSLRLGLKEAPEYARAEDYYGMKEKAGLLSAKARTLFFLVIDRFFYGEKTLFKRGSSAVTFSNENKLGKLLKSLRFESAALIKRYLQRSLFQFALSVRLAEKVMDGIKPDCIFYDIELYGGTPPFLFAAHKRGVKIVSMQHGEGFGEQYSRLPVMADYYIAYSSYNREKMRDMGVEEKNIFLTGTPDTDLLYNHDIEEIKEELKRLYRINCDRKNILVALRPGTQKSQGSYREMNRLLLDLVFDSFGNDDDYDIIVKVHPVDIHFGGSFSKIYDGDISRYRNLRVIDDSYPLSKVLRGSDYFITYISSCIVEAVLLGVPTIVLDIQDDALWPDWDSFGVYDTVPFSKLPTVLRTIKDGSYDYDSADADGSRDGFIERFRYKYDDGAAQRIADVCMAKDKTSAL